MITDEELDRYRIEGSRVRAIRDNEPNNDIKGIVVAWSDDKVLIRKGNRRVLELNRSYLYQPIEEKRPQSVVNDHGVIREAKQ